MYMYISMVHMYNNYKIVSKRDFHIFHALISIFFHVVLNK